MNNHIKIFCLMAGLSLLIMSTSCCTPLNVQTLNNKAHELMDDGDVVGAIGRLESINDLTPDSAQNNYNLGIAYHKNNELDKAIEKLTIAISLDPKLNDAYYALAVFHEEKADSFAETEKENKSKAEEELSEIEKLGIVMENLNKSKDYFITYQTLIKNPEEQENAQIKIEQLMKEIDKYEEKINKLEKE